MNCNILLSIISILTFLASSTATQGNCLLSADDRGLNYRGSVSVTKSGRFCRNWTELSAINETPSDYPTAGLNSSFCRNPTNKTRPYCFTGTGSKDWELCNISYCVEPKSSVQTTRDLVTSPSPTCSPGFQPQKIDDTKAVCVDINECDLKPCGIGWCNNLPGSYNCTCPSRTKFNSNTSKCEDINECEDPKTCVNGKCFNLLRNYGCYCDKGYHFDRTTGACVDIDECASHLDVCHSQAKCTNLIGHYSCECVDNFEGDGITYCKMASTQLHAFTVTCEPNLMKLEVPSWVIDTYGAMTLKDQSCKGDLKKQHSGNFWSYSIKTSLSNCLNEIEDNGTHFIYTNTLTNNASVISSSGIVSGHLFEAVWQCTFRSSSLLGSLNTGPKTMGAGFIHFPRGTPDQRGKYKSANTVLESPDGGVLAQTESPGGALVTDSSGYVVPVTYQDGRVAYGADGGRFVPVTDATGNFVRNEFGNIQPERYSNGSIITLKSHVLHPQLDGSSLDPRVYGGAQVHLTVDFSSPLEGAQEAGEPVLSAETLPNGTVVVPGLNYTLPDKILRLIPDKQRPNNTVLIDDVSIHHFGRGILKGTGMYDVKIVAFTDSSYIHQQLKTVFNPNDNLYLRAAVMTTDTRLAVQINKCWGSSDQSPSSASELSLIENRCAVRDALEGSVIILSNGESRSADFKTPVFKFPGSNKIYIHCEVDLCDLQKRVCKPSCDSQLDVLNRRRRRSANGTSSFSFKPTVVTFGPVTILPEIRIIIPAVVFIVVVVVAVTMVTACLCLRRKRQQRKKIPQML